MEDVGRRSGSRSDWYRHGTLTRKSNRAFEEDAVFVRRSAATMAAWTNGGAAEGDARDSPPQWACVESWSIPKPDVLFQFPRAFQTLATGETYRVYGLIRQLAKQSGFKLKGYLLPLPRPAHLIGITSLHHEYSPWSLTL